MSILTPNVAATYSDDTTPALLLSAPASGTTRIVSHVSLLNGDLATRKVWLYLYNGAMAYYLWYQELGIGESAFYPSYLHPQPFNIESGYALYIVTDGKSAGNIHAVASYANDVGDGGTDSDYHLCVANGNGTNWVTLVDDPDPKVRIVSLATFSNDDVIAHEYHFAMHDGSNRYNNSFTSSTVALQDVCGGIPRNGQVIVVAPGWELQVMAGIATDTAESHYTAHYYECDTDDSGET